MVGVPLFCFFFFPSLMQQGNPTEIPIASVDKDNSSLSRKFLQVVDALQKIKIVANYESEAKAREAVQRGEIQGFYYIPKGFSKDIYSQQQPKVSFYTNNAYFSPSSLLYKDMRQMSELLSARVAQKILLAKGATEKKTLALLQPIVIDAHALKNPWLDYSVYLNNIILPSILSLMIFLMTVYAIGVEIKDNTAREWLEKGRNSLSISLLGKLLPQTFIFMTMGSISLIILYGFLEFPMQNGFFPMFLGMFLLIISSQSVGIFIIALTPALRMGLSTASLWGMVSLSISGFSFPSFAMFSPVQAVSNLFPLRHYYLIYVSQALNGFPLIYAWKHYFALLLFVLLPFIVGKRLKRALLYYEYMP
ncbi:MAG: ABC transporter permease [Flavobacteriaceae bacterium]|nr:ABC transporter permease [Flavobacteriaceae bacterium]